mgnify:CR=1 FL=1
MKTVKILIILALIVVFGSYATTGGVPLGTNAGLSSEAFFPNSFLELSYPTLIASMKKVLGWSSIVSLLVVLNTLLFFLLKKNSVS